MKEDLEDQFKKMASDVVHTRILVLGVERIENFAPESSPHKLSKWLISTFLNFLLF